MAACYCRIVCSLNWPHDAVWTGLMMQFELASRKWELFALQWGLLRQWPRNMKTTSNFCRRLMPLFSPLWPTNRCVWHLCLHWESTQTHLDIHLCLQVEWTQTHLDIHLCLQVEWTQTHLDIHLCLQVEWTQAHLDIHLCLQVESVQTHLDIILFEHHFKKKSGTVLYFFDFSRRNS